LLRLARCGRWRRLRPVPAESGEPAPRQGLHLGVGGHRHPPCALAQDVPCAAPIDSPRADSHRRPRLRRNPRSLVAGAAWTCAGTRTDSPWTAGAVPSPRGPDGCSTRFDPWSGSRSAHDVEMSELLASASLRLVSPISQWHGATKRYPFRAYDGVYYRGHGLRQQPHERLHREVTLGSPPGRGG
jgi:hypothetical protein